jgi:hypothetical protein
MPESLFVAFIGMAATLMFGMLFLILGDFLVGLSLIGMCGVLVIFIERKTYQIRLEEMIKRLKGKI